MSVGLTAHHLGAGRQIPGDSINYAVGVQLKAQVGDFVNAGRVCLFVCFFLRNGCFRILIVLLTK